jgi:hypothetical protein
MRLNASTWKRALIATALVLAVLVGALVGSEPVQSRNAGTQSVVPNGLFTDLVKIDRKLSTLIDGLERNGWQRADLT